MKPDKPNKPKKTERLPRPERKRGSSSLGISLP